ncbi:50S ribosomal protein L24 [Patescibacteria group bacterium]|nr:50S ribosomal protein L24 [Patescibacteria group bacterium]MBU1922187.1 50S ribosomal protein L24 [Patescibacteria group bacterium]
MKIKKGDKVKILVGKDKGKTGKVIQIFPERDRLVIEDRNIMIKNVRPKRQGEKGQKVDFPAAISASNAELICPKCNRQTRIGHKILVIEKKKKKVRMCRKCKELIE